MINFGIYHQILTITSTWSYTTLGAICLQTSQYFKTENWHFDFWPVFDVWCEVGKTQDDKNFIQSQSNQSLVSVLQTSLTPKKYVSYNLLRTIPSLSTQWASVKMCCFLTWLIFSSLLIRAVCVISQGRRLQWRPWGSSLTTSWDLLIGVTPPNRPKMQ